MVFIKEYIDEYDDVDMTFKKEFEEEPELVSIKQSWLEDEENLIFQELLKEEPDWDLIDKSMEKGELGYTEWYKKDGEVSKRIWCKLCSGAKAKSSSYTNICLTIRSKSPGQKWSKEAVEKIKKRLIKQ